jgi:hypothetical protein
MERFMKLGALAISIFLTASISLLGCSKEQPSGNTEKKPIVKKAITQPTETKSPEPSSPAAVQPPETARQTSAEIKGHDEKEKDIYISKQGDSLSKIAGSNEVYKDPLKWIILYRYNREALSKIPKDESFPNKSLPVGTRLKIVSGSNSGKLNNQWVANALSSPEEKEVVPAALSLVDNGYPAYITKASVKGQNYLRLRVGFFKDRAAADTENKKIMSLLNISDAWITKAEESEIIEFGGYK